VRARAGGMNTSIALLLAVSFVSAGSPSHHIGARTSTAGGRSAVPHGQQQRAVVVIANQFYEPYLLRALQAVRESAKFDGTALAALDYEPAAPAQAVLSSLQVTTIVLQNVCPRLMELTSQFEGHSPFALQN